MNRLIPMETYRWAAPLFQCKMSSPVWYMMCSNCQISILSRFYFESLIEELFFGQQYSEAVEMVDKVDFKSSNVCSSPLSQYLHNSHSCNIGRWKQCFLDNIETWSSLQPLSTGDVIHCNKRGIKCSQLYSCKYQRLLITFINFNQSVSRLTILILMTTLPKEVSVKTSHVFNQP